MTTLTVVPLDPDYKPHVGSLTTGIKTIISTYVESNNVTLAEVVGCLEVIKHEYILGALDDA